MSPSPPSLPRAPQRTPAQEVLSKYGPQGEEVRQIQTKLKELGLYTGSIDGIYGSGTKNAVIQFQKQQGLDLTASPAPKP